MHTPRADQFMRTLIVDYEYRLDQAQRTVARLKLSKEIYYLDDPTGLARVTQEIEDLEQDILYYEKMIRDWKGELDARTETTVNIRPSTVSSGMSGQETSARYGCVTGM